MTDYIRKEKYNPEMTTSENDERSASWDEFYTELTRWIYESYELEMTITHDAFECEECGEGPATITVTKRDDDNHALHVVAKCLECEAVEDYYAYIAY